MRWELLGVPNELWDDLSMARMLVCSRPSAQRWHKVGMEVLTEQLKQRLDEGEHSQLTSVTNTDAFYKLLSRANHTGQNGVSLNVMLTTR